MVQRQTALMKNETKQIKDKNKQEESNGRGMKEWISTLNWFCGYYLQEDNKQLLKLVSQIKISSPFCSKNTGKQGGISPSL